MKKDVLKFSDVRIGWNPESTGSIKVRLPKDEYLLGLVRVDENISLLKSSNNWYWNVYKVEDRLKLQKLKI
ncbi:MAG TPA: hypothetical protein ENH85_09815 [Candidatus Scalindua sp.]|nr:hypothetical protein [Candidatus Scalindua sp.]